MTVLRTLPNEYTDAVGLAAVSVTTAEMDLNHTSSLAHWWRADAGFDASSRRWQDRKALLPLGGALTFVVVGRAGAGNNGVLVGSEAVASGAEGTLILHSNSNGSTKFQIEYPTNDRRNATSPGWYYADGPNIFVGSHNPAADEMALRINRGEYETTDMAGVSTANGNSTLTVGGAGPAGGSFGKMEGGDIAEIMIFTVALHQDATLLAAVEAYLGDRYGIAAP